MKACELKKGDVVAINAAPCMLEELSVSTPSARGAASIYHLRFRNLITKAKIDNNVRGDEPYAVMDFERRPVQFLYKDKDEFTFMDSESFEQFTLMEEDLSDKTDYLVEDMEGITALLSDGKVLSIEMPQSVNLEVVSCDPSARNASATARTKNAVLQTGLNIQVPEYVETGEILRVDTRTGKYMSRA
ncbi:MAG: elongation factor P [Kiritimatiellaeota bacterium]|nr:elongation factor P [Kiritimatiellota bacterium]